MAIKLSGGVALSGEFELEKQLIKAIALQSGKTITIEIKPFAKARSNPQSRYRWGVVVPLVQERLREDGILWTADQTNEMLKYLTGCYFHYDILNNQKLPVYEDTKDKGPREFEEWMVACRMWAHQELGLIIPLPNEEGYDQWVNEQISKESTK